MEPKCEREERVRQLRRSMKILKEIFTIIMALAFTNAIIHFFAKTNADGIYEGIPLSDIGCIKWWVIFLIITTIIRFYHGNSIHLNNVCRVDLLLENRMHNTPCTEALFLILESIIFALMSIYQSNVEYLFWLFVILFGIDLILFSNSRRIIYKKLSWFIRYSGKSIRERVRKSLKVKKLMELRRYSVRSILKQVRKSLDDLICRYSAETKWTIVNTFTVIILLGLWNYRGGSLFVDHTYEFLTIITLNLALDYGLNWKFYFPPIHGT